MDTMHSRFVNGKLLRRGYTTGSCAAAAAKAATDMLLTQRLVENVTLSTPNGITLTLDVTHTSFTPDAATCAVQKDSGDDPDVTNSVFVHAHVTQTPSGITIEGGEGIGRVTKPGLDQPVGAAAVNSTPRRMIAEVCENVCQAHGYTGGLCVTISIPGGEALAAKTFNPRFGIEGGLSVLGTTGIVEPMSEAAIVESIRAELSLLRAAGRQTLLLTIGNYGETFARDKLGLPLDAHVMCSNFIGETLDLAVALGFTDVTLVGHIGKLVKLGLGITNTHSRHGDGRMETMLACALDAGGSIELLRQIRDCVSTDAALDCLRAANLLAPAMDVLRARVMDTVTRCVAERMAVRVVCFGGLGDNTEEVFTI